MSKYTQAEREKNLRDTGASFIRLARRSDLKNLKEITDSVARDREIDQEILSALELSRVIIEDCLNANFKRAFNKIKRDEILYRVNLVIEKVKGKT